MELAVIIGTVVVLVVLGFLLFRQGNPEHATPGVDEREPTGPTGEDYPTGARPAGPDAEPQTPEAMYGEERPEPDS